MKSKLTLITTYRNRPKQLEIYIAWLCMIRAKGFHDFNISFIEGDEYPMAEEKLASYRWINYQFYKMSEHFHKTKLLNLALKVTKEDFIIFFDIDLLPSLTCLYRTLKLASLNQNIIISGYRLQLASYPKICTIKKTKNSIEYLNDLLESGDDVICSENNKSALRKQLLLKERFGVCPCFPRYYIEAVNGLDENYIGWGAEDQDLLQRILKMDLFLVQSPDLLYYHLPAPLNEKGWKDKDLINTNRNYFYKKFSEL